MRNLPLQFFPAFCLYGLYLVVCAFVFGMTQGMCLSPKLGLTLLVVFLSLMNLAAFGAWQEAIYSG